MKPSRIKIAVLIDLPAGQQAGGHVKMWQNLAAATARSHLPVDLTVYFSGPPLRDVYADHVRALHLPPVFSTARLAFLPYLPDHTDLARYHRQLARHLRSFDIVHTTDAFFAFARTAERLRRKADYALVHSFHTDQPAYSEIFMRRSLEQQLGRNGFTRLLTNGLRLPQLARHGMQRRQAQHLRLCDHVLATRPEDRAQAEQHAGAAQVTKLRLGVDRGIFRPGRRQREALCAHYGIPPERLLVLFAGRLDEGKNIYPLLTACHSLRSMGYAPHLLTAGVGPADKDIQAQLGEHATLCGFVPAEHMAALYSGADVLAIPSEVEIGSLVLIEALACGLPVLVSAGSDLAALHGPSPALEPVAAGAQAWANALHNLMAQPDKLRQMQEAAQQYGQNRIADWNTILREDLFPAWEQALARRAGRRPAARAA